jgi:voltage-gated potassium channel
MATSSITGIGEVERKALLVTGLRAALSAGVLIATYYLVPVDHRHHGHGLAYDLGIGMRISVAVVIFITVLALEIRAITKAEHPIFLLFFSWTYLTMSNSDPSAFAGGRMDKTTALYFTVTVFATVGFGDITPLTGLARLLTTFQMLADLAVVVVVIRLILGAARDSTSGRGGGQGGGSSSHLRDIPTT